jgi:hypothetical protein
MECKIVVHRWHSLHFTGGPSTTAKRRETKGVWSGFVSSNRVSIYYRDSVRPCITFRSRTCTGIVPFLTECLPTSCQRRKQLFIPSPSKEIRSHSSSISSTTVARGVSAVFLRYNPFAPPRVLTFSKASRIFRAVQTCQSAMRQLAYLVAGRVYTEVRQ